jgi:protein-tyrosine-phosphatase
MFRHTSFVSDTEDKDKKKPEKPKKELKVLFVSRLDSCRGPMADCIFTHIADKHAMKPYARFNWRSMSAGLRKYNQGNLPEQLALRVLAENHLETMHGCRQVSLHDLELYYFFSLVKHTLQFIDIRIQIRPIDFNRYDYILCMEPSQ